MTTQHAGVIALVTFGSLAIAAFRDGAYGGFVLCASICGAITGYLINGGV